MIQENLKVNLIQSNTQWMDASSNCVRLEKMILAYPLADIHILPETFNTGFAIDKSLAETMSGPSVTWMLSLATRANTVICGSILIKDKEKTYNRFIWAQADGTITSYDKRHLFSLAQEETQFDPGDKQVLISYKGWNIRPLICYDLRFPVWSRNNGNTDLILYVANWPKPRIHAWSALLTARAIENQCYVIGVNRVGEDPSGMSYPGKSVVISPMGFAIAELSEEEVSEQVEISFEGLKRIREKINFQKDRDSFSIH